MKTNLGPEKTIDFTKEHSNWLISCIYMYLDRTQYRRLCNFIYEYFYNTLYAVQSHLSFRFDFVFVLSAADSDWTGSRGRISEALLREVVPEAAADADGAANEEARSDRKMFACVCGPDAFTDSAVRFVISWECGLCEKESRFIFPSTRVRKV